MEILTAATVKGKGSPLSRGLRVSRGGRLDPSLLTAPVQPDPASALLSAYDRPPARLVRGSHDWQGFAREWYGVVSITPGTVAFRFVDGARSGSSSEGPASLSADPADKLGHLVEPDLLEGWEEAPESARVIREWSGKSRARMLRTIASLDLGPLYASGDPLGMLTLTLPGEWLMVAPDAASWALLVERFVKRFERRFGRRMVGIWKREFQRRGAPHLHILMPIPAMTPELRTKRGNVRKGGQAEPFELWVSRTWAAVVAHPMLCHRLRHERAGTGVDFSKSPYMTSAVDMARYFLKHSAKTMDNKEYQHVAPEAWAGGVGRYWGVWGLSVSSSGARLTEAETYRVRRVLRRWDRANAAHYGRRRRRSLGMVGRSGAWVLVDDPPRFIGQVLAAAGVSPFEETGTLLPKYVARARDRSTSTAELAPVARCVTCGERLAAELRHRERHLGC